MLKKIYFPLKKKSVKGFIFIPRSMLFKYDTKKDFSLVDVMFWQGLGGLLCDF